VQARSDFLMIARAYSMEKRRDENGMGKNYSLDGVVKSTQGQRPPRLVWQN